MTDMNTTTNTNTARADKIAALAMIEWANLGDSRSRAYAHHLVENLRRDPADAFAEVALIEVEAGRRLFGPRVPRR